MLVSFYRKQLDDFLKLSRPFPSASQSCQQTSSYGRSGDLDHRNSENKPRRSLETGRTHADLLGCEIGAVHGVVL